MDQNFTEYMHPFIFRKFSPIVFCLSSLLWWSCTSENASLKEEAGTDPKVLSFQVVDSIAVEYLGKLRFCDISPDKSKFLFYDHQRGNFLTTDKQGNILFEFIKTGDRPDLPAFIDNPVFWDNDVIALLGANTVLFYDLNGEVLDYQFNQAGKNRFTLMVQEDHKTLHKLVSDGKTELLRKVQLRFDRNDTRSFIEQLDHLPLVEVVDPKEGIYRKLIPIPAESKIRSNPAYINTLIDPTIYVSQGRVFIGFKQDLKVYVYSYADGEFELESTIPLSPDVFFDDEPKESDNYPLNLRPAGAGSLRFVYGYNDFLFTGYNAGVRPEERLLPEIHSVNGNLPSSMTIRKPMLPKDNFQLFVNGSKLGPDFEKPDFLSRFIMGDEEYLWFTRNTSKDEVESDFVVFYKVGVVAK